MSSIRRLLWVGYRLSGPQGVGKEETETACRCVSGQRVSEVVNKQNINAEKPKELKINKSCCRFDFCPMKRADESLEEGTVLQAGL